MLFFLDFLTGSGGGPNLTMLFFFDFLTRSGGGPNLTMLFFFDFLTGSGGGPNLTMLFFFRCFDRVQNRGFGFSGFGFEPISNKSKKSRQGDHSNFEFLECCLKNADDPQGGAFAPPA